MSLHINWHIRYASFEVPSDFPEPELIKYFILIICCFWLIFVIPCPSPMVTLSCFFYRKVFVNRLYNLRNQLITYTILFTCKIKKQFSNFLFTSWRKYQSGNEFANVKMWEETLNPSPSTFEKNEESNIFKYLQIVGIPTPKPFIFLFLEPWPCQDKS